MASSHATTTEGERRPKLVVVDTQQDRPEPGRLHRFAARLLDRATLSVARSRQRHDLGALYATAETGRETGARC
ncbi:MAG: hypothetical protein QOC87_669 [Actinomycetota bacterium]|nr:hypothetical protein [Actinomycetota bacterium]